MQLIKIEDLIIPPNRQRRHFDEERIRDLSRSIATKGLLHPIVVYTDDEGRSVLVAGERRLRAIQLLHKDKILFSCDGSPVLSEQAPCIWLSDLDPLERREAELEENTIRDDLTLQEKAAAVAKLHRLRLEQNPDQTQSDTAEEVTGNRAGSTAKVRDMLLISDHIDNPDVANAKTSKEALKAIKKEAQRDLTAALVELYGEQTEDDFLIYLGEAEDSFDLCDDAEFDCIIADPPYGIGADTFGDMSDFRHNYKDDSKTFWEIMKWFPYQAYRTCKAQGHLYMFCDIRLFFGVMSHFTTGGWAVWPKPLIWDKGNGMLPRPEHGPRYTYDAILFASKGDKKVTGVAPDVLRYSAVSGQKLLHAAQKPVEVYNDLLRRSCLPGDLVLDPFAGSGTIFDSAKILSLRATGFERIEENYNICKARIKGALEE